MSIVDEFGVLKSDLWIDQPNALQVAAARAADAGLLGSYEEELKRLITEGYAVLDLKLPDQVFSDIETEIEGIWRDRPRDVAYGGKCGDLEGIFAMGDLPAHITRENPANYRLTCAHSHSPTMTDLYMNRDIHRFISTLFGEPCVATQTLSFHFGSQQGLHRDTSVVSYDPLPHLCAAWIALEDIDEDCGPLEYVPQSHRVENYTFPDGSLIWSPEYGPSAFGDMDKGIRRVAEQQQLSPRRFTAKKGECFIWHHSLAHGGAPVLHPGRTRRSLVIHFTTLSTFKKRDHALMYRPTPDAEWWYTELEREDMIERDGRYGAESGVAGWLDRALPPTRPARSITYQPKEIADFSGEPNDRYYRDPAIEGWVDEVTRHDTASGLRGWAANKDTGQVAAHVVAVSGGRLVAACPTLTLRTDVATAMQCPQAAYCGYYMLISNEIFDASVADIELYAVYDDGAFARLKGMDEHLGRATKLYVGAEPEAVA